MISRNEYQGKSLETNLPFLQWSNNLHFLFHGRLLEEENEPGRAARDPHLVPGVAEQLGRRQPADPCAHHDHARRAGRGLQPIPDNLQQLLVVLVVETILGKAREPLGAQQARQQEDLENGWGGKKRREGNSAASAQTLLASKT